MNKFLYDIGGHRLLLDDFGFIQDSTFEQLKNLVKSLTNSTDECIKLWGGVVSVVGSTYSITAGAFFYNDEIYTIDATSFIDAGTPQFKIITTYLPIDPVVYKDAHSFSPHQIRKISLVSSTTSGALFNYNDASIKDLKDLLKARLGLVDYSLGTKTALATVNSYSWAPETAYYRKDTNGRVVLMGGIAAPGSVSSPLVATLPVGYRPAFKREYVVGGRDFGSTVGGMFILQIGTDGSIFITNINGSTIAALSTFYLDPVSFNVND